MIFGDNEVLSSGFLGFGGVLITLGVLVIVYAFYKILKIEYKTKWHIEST